MKKNNLFLWARKTVMLISVILLLTFGIPWVSRRLSGIEPAEFPGQSADAETVMAERPVSEPESGLDPAFAVYPVGKLSVSQERKDYTDGEMTLEIPRLDLSSPVIAGTSDTSLNRGVGLFEYAHLPGPYNSNTSMAAHRDIGGKEFYYIDTITTGDLMYLTYQGKKYTYEYVETFITGDSDWAPIRAKDFACITLQSCDPIGTSLNRIFVVGRLIDTQDVE